MIRKGSDRIVEKPQRKFGAPGFITVRQLINDPAELNGKGRVFAHTTVLPGNGIGYHVHVGDAEIYYVYSGKGEYNDNGTIVPCKPGDVFKCEDGGWHCIINDSDEDIEFIALIAKTI